MTPASLPPAFTRCDCCGLAIQPQMGETCPRCGYPISPLLERTFLETQLRDLQRVATYGGSRATVASLITRYQQRMSLLQQLLAQQSTASSQSQGQFQPGKTVSSGQWREYPVASGAARQGVQGVQPVQQPRLTPTLPTSQEPHPSPLAPMPPAVIASMTGPGTAVPVPEREFFSLKSFLAEQTITIVSSLGAFFILVGALGFVATTTNLLIAFLVTFSVHALFAIVGSVFRRLDGFRLVSRIYLAIFALLVPLVGFSAYRLVSHHLIEVSTPTLISIAAVYAALVYAFLAVSQRFRPFAYLSIVSLVIADLSLASALHLGLWWWPCMLMPLAFASLTSLRTIAPRVFIGKMSVLREATYALLLLCIATFTTCIPVLFAQTLLINSFAHSLIEVRYALFVLLFLVCVWTGTSILLSRTYALMPLLAYEFLSCVLALNYALSYTTSRYIITITSVALLYHIATRLIHRAPQHSTFTNNLYTLSLHFDSIALILCCLVPLITAPTLPLTVLVRAYHIARFYIPFPMTDSVWIGLIALVIGVVLTCSVTLHRVSISSAQAQRRWQWTLLSSAFLLNSLVSILLLNFNVAPYLCFLGLTLTCIMLAIVFRRVHGSLWADVLDVISLIEASCTVLLSVGEQQNTTLILLLFFAALSYIIVLYQRRSIWLFLPLVFTFFAFFLALAHPVLTLCIAVLLPLASALVYRTLTQREEPLQPRQAQSSNISATSPRIASPELFSKLYKIHWEWPLLLTGAWFGVTLYFTDIVTSTNALQSLLHIPLSAAIEVALLAVVWYVTALLTGMKWELVLATAAAIAALLLPISFWTLVALAPLFLLLALGTQRIAGRDWAIPFYTIAVVAEIVMGANTYGTHLLPIATWLLLGFAALLYLTGVVEDAALLRWISVGFATWSLLNTMQAGNLWQLTCTSIVCVCIALAIRNLPLAAMEKWRALRFSLPIYVTAFIATLCVAGYGIFINPDAPFYAAVPCLLFLFALLAYIIALLERWSDWLWLVAAYAIGAVLLLLNTTSCVLPMGLSTLGLATCSTQIQTTFYLFSGIALLTGILALIINRFIPSQVFPSRLAFTTFTSSWPWFLTSLLTIVVASLWCRTIDINTTNLLPARLEYTMLLSFIALTVAIMFIERLPALLLLVTGLAIWTLVRLQIPLWQLAIALNALFILVFMSQLLWRMIPASQQQVAARLHSLVGVGGQLCVVAWIVLQGGLFAGAGILTHVGAGSLLVLALLLFLYDIVYTSDSNSYSQRGDTGRWWCDYVGGFLVALAVSWELLALHQTHLDVLSLAPASYLIIIASLLTRDERVLYRHRLSQICSLLGSIMLLLPALWLSFSESNLQPTIILAGESLALLVVGVGTRIRIFVLSGAALVIVSALHALFLPSLGIPSSLAMALLGGILLVLATVLSIARHRLQTLWVRLE